MENTQIDQNDGTSASDISDGSPARSSVVSSLSYRQSRGTESSASVAMLRFVRSSFPILPLETVFDMLLGGPQGEPTFSHRTFTATGIHGPAFEAGRKSFIANTLEKLKPPPSVPLNHPLIRLEPVNIEGKAPKYVSKNYTSVEMDSLLKVPWLEDMQWDMGCEGSSGFFTIRSSSPLSPPSTSSTPAPTPLELASPGFNTTPPSSPCSLSSGSQPIPSSFSTNTQLLDHEESPSLGVVSAFKRIGSGAGVGGGHNPSLRPSPSFSDKHYLKGSSMYILGETHLSLGAKEENEQLLVQKMLQAERNVCFLTAKEGKSVEECILGVIFFSSKMTKTFGVRLGNALKYYKDSLPCLWKLCGMSRFMGCTLEDTHHSAPIMRLEVKMERRFDQVGGRMDRLEAKVDELGGKVGELGGKVGELGEKVGELGGKVGELGGRMDRLEAKVGELGGKLDRLLLAANNQCCSIM